MYFLKKLISRLLFPIPLSAELLVAGLVLLFFTKRQKLAKGLLVAGTAVLLLASLPVLPPLLMRPLERQFPAAMAVQTPESGKPKAEATLICVLGQGVSANTNLPANARFNQEFLPRLTEAARLHKAIPGSIILVSIAGKTIPEPEKVRVLADFYGLFGITTNGFQVWGDALDTVSEVQYFKTKTGTNRVYLVSSASHLPRAMVIARRYGLDAIPAAGSYLVDDSEDTESPFDPSGLFPGAASAFTTERAIYEYLGLMFEKLKPRPQPPGGQ